jgi:hypothetical protein
MRIGWVFLAPNQRETLNAQACSIDLGRYFLVVKVAEIKHLVERRPFRRFSLRLSNGALYDFKNPRDVGAPKDYRLIIYFGKSEAVRIDTDNIVELLEQ